MREATATTLSPWRLRQAQFTLVAVHSAAVTTVSTAPLTVITSSSAPFISFFHVFPPCRVMGGVHLSLADRCRAALPPSSPPSAAC